MPDRVSVSSADFIRNIGYWQSEALRYPLSITHHGRERLVLAGADYYKMEVAKGDASADADNQAALLRARQVAILENTSEGFAAFDERLRIQEVNGVTEAFTGRARADLAGASALESFPQPMGAIVAERLQRVARTRKLEVFEAAAFDGRVLGLRIFPYGDGLALLFDNLTEVRAFDARLERSKALDAAVASARNVAMMRLDGRGRIEACDEIWCAWSGFQSGELAGHRLIELIAAPARSAVSELIEKVLRTTLSGEMGAIIVGKKGEEIAAVLSMAAIVSDSVAHGVMIVCVRGAGSDLDQRAA